MAGPWDDYQKQPEPAGKPWEEYKPPAKQGGSTILPLSMDANGKPQLDWNEGIIGSLKRSFMLPGDVLTGKVDPNSEEGRRRAFEMGATFAGSPTAATVTERGLMGMKPVPIKPKVPTAEELYGAAKTGYNQARDMGVDYSGDAIKGLASTVQQTLQEKGIISELTPKTYAILDKLGNPPPDAVASLANIDAVRRALGNAAKDFANPTERLAAQHAIDAIDKFVMAPDASAVVAGPAAAAGKTIGDARGNYAAASRSDRITGAQERGELNAAVANSGQNTGNAVRQRIAAILKSDKQSRGFTPEELARMEAVATGTFGANATRAAGNMMGGGGGLGSVVSGAIGGAGASAMTGSPLAASLGVAVPALGYGLKKASNSLTGRSVSNLDEMVRMRSPLYDQLLANAPTTTAQSARYMELARRLLMGGSAADTSSPRGLLD